MNNWLQLGLTLILMACMGEPAFGSGAELRLLPPTAVLDGPNTARGFVVEERDANGFDHDRTVDAKFTIDDPSVAAISNDGSLVPKSDGRATLSASLNGKTATATIVVTHFDKPAEWSFRNHVLPVLTKMGCNSGACHGAAAGKNGLRLTLRGYAPEIDYNTLTRQVLARRINKTAPAESLMLLKATGAIAHGGGARFGTDSLEYKVISGWIANGIAPPKREDPRIRKLQVYPNAVRQKLGDRQRIVVIATDSEGRAEDVSRWARFASTDETVVKVDDKGLATIQGNGEGSITVGYAGLVARSTITSPYSRMPAESVFARAANAGKIDDLNLAKLRSLGIEPAGDCGDATFLRRAFLDATGTLPPSDRVKAYLTDQDPNKRVKLIDELLASPEYVDYWTYKWSDLFLVASNRLPSPAVWSFHRFIRESVKQNVPWDRFAREIVTAKGSTIANGAANFYVLHRDPIDLTETTSMAFLGLSLTCARCHDHPLEKWTQDQYYGVANLFARVKLKDGGSAGDVEVIADTDGNIPHPRSGKVLQPCPLDSDPMASDARGDRRIAFADWLAKPDNPYFAKAIVNRIWRNFFGRGLVDPEDDLRATNPASDEQLLDWLVADFQTHRYNVRHLIQIIMTSAVYARAATPAAGIVDTKFLSHYPVKRLSAEVLLDAISKVSGVPSQFPGYPAGWGSLQLPDSKVESGFLTSFGRPERISTCSCERSSEPSVAQALHLANGKTINEKLRSDASQVALAAASSSTDLEVVSNLFRAALTRAPTESEQARIVPALAEATQGIADSKEKTKARRQAIEDLFWAVLTSDEFLFNH